MDTVISFVVAVVSMVMAAEPASPAGESPSPVLRLARSYLAACDNADRGVLDSLFLDNGRATVLENAADEGTWEHHRDHHLMPELAEMKGVRFILESEAEQTFGSTSVVRHIGSFSVPDPKNPNEPRKFISAVTYVIVLDGDKPKIAHLHWSSRAARKRATQPTQGQ